MDFAEISFKSPEIETAMFVVSPLAMNLYENTLNFHRQSISAIVFEQLFQTLVRNSAINRFKIAHT